MNLKDYLERNSHPLLRKRISVNGRKARIVEIREKANQPTEIIGKYLYQRKPGKYFTTNEGDSLSYISPKNIEILD